MPIIAGMAAASLVSGLMQYYASEKARGAQQAQLDQIKAMFDKIVPPNYNVNVWDDPKLVGNIPPPALDGSALTPEDYRSMGQYIPQVAQFVKEQGPQLIQASQVGKDAQAAQLSALDRYKQIASGSYDPQFAQLQQEASDRSRRDAQSQVASQLEAANRRGSLDSGVQLAAQLQGGSNAMQRGALESQQAATDAYKNQLQALGASATLGGQIRNQDVSLQGANAGIINDFNQRTSKEYQQYLQQRTAAANQAAIYNLDNTQRISDANVAQRNAYAKYNQQNQNQVAQQDFQNKNLNRQNQIDVELQKDRLKAQGFGDQMAQANGKAGIGYNQINMIGQATRDQNQAIQGLGNAATSTMMYSDYQDRHPVPPGTSSSQTPTFTGSSTGSGQGYGTATGYAGSSQMDGSTGQNAYQRPYTYDDWLAKNGGQ